MFCFGVSWVYVLRPRTLHRQLGRYVPGPGRVWDVVRRRFGTGRHTSHFWKLISGNWARPLPFCSPSGSFAPVPCPFPFIFLHFLPFTFATHLPPSALTAPLASAWGHCGLMTHQYMHNLQVCGAGMKYLEKRVIFGSWLRLDSGLLHNRLPVFAPIRGRLILGEFGPRVGSVRRGVGS